MTAIEELKQSTRDSLAAKQRILSELAESRKEKDLVMSEFRDTILDLLIETPAFYKVTVAQVREAQSVEEVAALWQETHAAYESILSLWQALNAVFDNPSDELFVYWGKMIEKLERASAQAYEFHA